MLSTRRYTPRRALPRSTSICNPSKVQAKPLLVLYSLYNSPSFPLIQTIQLRHIICIKLKAIYIRITNDPRRRIALRQWHESLLQTPPHENLIRSNVVLLAYTGQGLVLCFLVADEWTVRFDDDVVLFAVLYAFALLAPWVELGYVSRLLFYVVNTAFMWKCVPQSD